MQPPELPGVEHFFCLLERQVGLTLRLSDVFGSRESEAIALSLHLEQQKTGEMEQMVFALGTMHWVTSSVQPPLRAACARHRNQDLDPRERTGWITG